MLEIVFVIPVVTHEILELVMEGVRGIRSLSELPIKIVAPFRREIAWCSSFVDQRMKFVDLVDIEDVASNEFDSDAPATPLFTALKRTAAVTAGDFPRTIIFAGVEGCLDTLGDYRFLLKRRFASARLLALNIRPSYTGSGHPVCVDLAESLHAQASSMIGCFPPRYIPVERLAREEARARLGLKSEEFVVLILDRRSGQHDTCHFLTFIRALSKARTTRFLAIEGVLNTTEVSTVIVPPTETEKANAFSAADLIVGFTWGNMQVDHAVRDGVEQCTIVRDDVKDKLVLIGNQYAHETIDDFNEAIGLLPLTADRQAELLRSALVMNLLANADLNFGRNLFRLVNQTTPYIVC